MQSNILRTISDRTPTARLVFNNWATRKRHRGALDIVKNKRALRKAGEVIDDKEYETMINDLQKQGFGKVIKDHQGHSKYFQLNSPIYEIGKSAITGIPLTVGKKNGEEAAKEEAKRSIKRSPPVPKIASKPGDKTIVYLVVEGRKIRLEIDGLVNEDILDKALETFKGQLFGNT